jgi:D-methionine transport system ATP-binding protein
MTIRLENLRKTYDSGKAGKEVRAVNDISLEIPSNKIFGIIGKSGAGKSTLVRLVSLLERPDSGEVLYDGQRVDNLKDAALIARRRRIGMIFQNFNLFSSRTAAGNIAYPLEICGTPKSKIQVRTAELLDLVGLSDRADAPISTLSGGQKQRIAIARALANNPDILFCDEATSALDPQTTLSILNLIREIQKKMNLTVVMITHQMEVVRDACSLVAVIHDGAVVEQGSVDDIFVRPQTDVTRDFLAHLTQPSASLSDQNELVRWSSDGGNYTLRFIGGKTDEPVLSRLARKFEVEFNIRAGGIQKLSTEKVGTLLIDIYGAAEEVSRALEYLRDQGIIVEQEKRRDA